MLQFHIIVSERNDNHVQLNASLVPDEMQISLSSPFDRSGRFNSALELHSEKKFVFLAESIIFN